MDCFPFIVTLSRERYSVLGFIACYSSRGKETSDLMVKGKKFNLQENDDEYGGHNLNSFPCLYYTSICTNYVDSHVDESLWMTIF